MNWWQRLWHRGRMEDHLARELNFHLEQHVADLVARGCTPEDARRQARLALGGVEQVKESCREARGTRWLLDLRQDLRYALRVLSQKPGFTVVAVFTLALGIGASTAIFSAVKPILFEPLPYRQPSRIMMVWDVGREGSPLEVTFGTYRELAERSLSFDALSVMKPWQATLTGAGDPERFDGQRVSSSYFRALGVAPVMGRDFQASDDVTKGPNVVILSDGLWRRRFARDSGIVGRQVILNDSPYTVIGVMPGGFENVLAPSAEFWAPLQYDPSLPPQGREWGHHLRMVARLQAGIGAEQARREVDDIARNSVPQFSRAPWASLNQGLILSPLQEDITRGVKPALLAVLGAVQLLLVIACINVANLLLARGAQRRGEFAMRVALGAGRARLIRQLLTEHLLLAAFGGIAGMVLAQLGVDVLVAFAPLGLPRVGAIRLDPSAFAFGMTVTTVIGLVFGLIPALLTSRGTLHIGLQQASGRTAGGHQWTRRVLVAAEVGLAVVLLVSAGLLLRSLQRLFAIDPGFETAHLLTMEVQVSVRRFNDDDAARRFFAQSLEAVRRVPGVNAAAFTSQLPLSGDFAKYGVELESEPNSNLVQDRSAFRYAVSPGYFEAVGIPLRRGRLLNSHDGPGAPVAVIISESLARNRFARQDPIGQRIRIGRDLGRRDKPWNTIVGVVGDVKQMSLAATESDAVYITDTQASEAERVMSLVVRADGEAAALAPAIRKAIWSVDKDQPVVRVATVNDLLAVSAAERRFALGLFGAFALVALALAGVGIYGVLSGSVAERTRELGVRSAMGATRGNLLALVLRQGMILTVIGVAVGLAGAAAASRALGTMLFSVSPLDPLTYAGVIALMVSVSGIACWVPAWRAAQVDPTITLRAE